MDNPETQTAFGTRHKNKTNKTTVKSTTQETKKMCNKEPSKKIGVNTGAGER